MEDRKCNYCSAPASLRCSSCTTTYYCNPCHQKNDWTKHKSGCKPFRQVSDPTFGRYLIASRDIIAGTLLLKECPIVRGPPACSFLVCIGCNAPIVRSDFYKCPNCSWPACSQCCLTANNHELECSVLRKDSTKCGVPFDTVETPRYDLILIVRCLLLKQADPSKWQAIQSLEGHSEQRNSDPYHIAAVRYLTEVCKVDFDARSVQHVRGAVITNSINTMSVFGTTVRGIYPNISMLNHSCVPNITLRSDKYHTIYVRATVNIEKGQQLNFSYIPLTEPLWKRKEDLNNIYFFDCNCVRCQDPAELGSQFSNPKCPACRKGYVRRTTKSAALWKCSKCPKKMSYDDVISFSDGILNELLVNKSTLRTKSDLQSAINASASHYNHYAYLSLLQSLLNHGAIINPSMADLDLRIYAWKEILRMLTLLEPGLTRRRGVSLVQLSSLLITNLNEKGDDARNNSKPSHLPAEQSRNKYAKANNEDEKSCNEDEKAYNGDEKIYSESEKSHNQDEKSYNEDEKSYNEDEKSYNEDEKSYNEDEKSYNEDAISHNEKDISYSEDKTPRNNNETVNTNGIRSFSKHQTSYTDKKTSCFEEAKSYIAEALLILNLEPVDSTELKWLQLSERIKEEIK